MFKVGDKLVMVNDRLLKAGWFPINEKVRHSAIMKDRGYRLVTFVNSVKMELDGSDFGFSVTDSDFDIAEHVKGMSKKNEKRYRSFFDIAGSPKKVRVYSNLGMKSETADCYTIVFTGNYRKNTNGQFWAIGCGTNPFHPCGIGFTNEYDRQIDRPKHSHLGKKIRFVDLSEDAQEYVKKQYKYLWNFTDEHGRVI